MSEESDNAESSWKEALADEWAVEEQLDDLETTVRLRRRSAVTLALSDGRVFRVQAKVVVGRNPSDDGDDVVVTVQDSTVSKTHFAVGVRDGVVWVRDLQSTNGTTVESDAEGIVHVAPGQEVVAPVPSVVLFGSQQATLQFDT